MTILGRFIFLALLEVLILVEAQDRQIAPDEVWNKRRVYQAVRKLGNRVYFHGGELSKYEHASDSVVPPKFDPMTDTSWLPLDESWDTSSAEFYHIPQNDDELKPLNGGALWADDMDMKLYHWGGGRSLNKPIDGGDVALWVFTPDDNSGGTWEKQEYPDKGTSDIASAQSGGSISCGRKGYYIGGYAGLWTDNKFGDLASSRLAVPGILTYDMASRSWSNHSTAPMSPPDGTIIAGKAACTDAFQTPLIFSIGGKTSDPNLMSTQLISVMNITFWDPSQERWLWQRSDGDPPPRSENPCVVGAASQNGTYEIFVYGGSVDGESAHGEMHILSLPGFQWFKIDIPSPERVLHTCEYVGHGQMLSSGGHRKLWTWNETDDWPHALGIFDMTSLQWKPGYDADLPDYDSPDIVKDWYNNGGLNAVKWQDDEIKSIFVGELSNGGGGGPGKEPGKGVDSSSTNTGAIAGGVVGGVVGVALMGFVIWLLLKGRQRREHDPSKSHHPAAELPVQPEESEYKYSSLVYSPSSPMPVEMSSPDHMLHEMAGNEHVPHEIAPEGSRRSELPT